jgi:hypothetical protein
MIRAFWGDQTGNASCIHTCSRIYYVLNKWSCYTFGVCLVVWMQYKLVCENMADMLLLHLICIHFQKKIAHIWSSWDLAFVMLPLH